MLSAIGAREHEDARDVPAGIPVGKATTPGLDSSPYPVLFSNRAPPNTRCWTARDRQRPFDESRLLDFVKCLVTMNGIADRTGNTRCSVCRDPNENTASAIHCPA